MLPITIAIADEDVRRRTHLEQVLKTQENIQVLTNVATCSHGVTRNRRRACRTNLSAADEIVARVRRLLPRVLLIHLNCCVTEQDDVLDALSRECPNTRVLILTERPEQHESLLIHALAKGARGYLDIASESSLISKAAQVIDDGGAWVPRRMLGTIMEQVVQWQH